MNLDPELVARAREVLKAKNASDTIRQALNRVIEDALFDELSNWQPGDLTPEALSQLRESRPAKWSGS